MSRTNWFQVIATDATGHTYPTDLVVSADYRPAFLYWTPAETPAPITNYTLLVSCTNAAGRVAIWRLNVGTNTAAVWPPASVPRSNVVVTVRGTVATAETLDGPWVTNQAVLWQATNPPGMRFWRQTGLSITSTNF